jgi:hypothetical protein
MDANISTVSSFDAVVSYIVGSIFL